MIPVVSKEQMKILIVTGPNISLKEPYSSGIEAFVVSLADKLVESGHIVDVIAKDAEPYVLFNVVNLASLHNKNNKELSEEEQLKNFAKLNIRTYDMIHYNLFIPMLYEIAATFEKPSILTLHSPVDSERSKTYKKFARKSNVTFVAISSRMQAQWSAALNIDVKLIRNGITTNDWLNHHKYQDKYFLWSGRINWKKNPLAAISLAKHTNSKLKIAGRITDQQYFDTYVAPQLGNNIEYVGHMSQSKLRELAGGASVFLATAIWEEPFGLSSLEMMAAGLPVIGFETALPSDLREKGISEAVNSSDWKDLMPLIKNVDNATPEQCRSFARKFDSVNMARNYVKLYQNISQDNPHSQLAVSRIMRGLGIVENPLKQTLATTDSILNV